ncbi:MAG: putative permease [Candidatus Methanohalarchaeum thermophilum]|uniref:Permease n=1 Tax=Methanohalarchaeum thermophilum TaxID=1903181 RepID=A0A1Q6DSD2_METT1|nr:MAG: putative permease [Candidatus Methanohalarchaeum thermophilum]
MVLKMVFKEISDFIVSALGLTGKAAAAVDFWIYDTLKITFILLLVILGIGYLRTYIRPEDVRDYLQDKNVFVGYLGASILGIVSPFCSCSTIPIFLGFMGAGVPFGMALTFLVTSPMINEAAIFVLFGVLGWKLTTAYIVGGITVGMVGGFLLTKLGFQKYAKSFKFGDNSCKINSTTKDRLKQAYAEAKDILKSIFPYVVVGVGIGAIIHGFIPRNLITKYLTGTLAVPAAVVVGVPVYTNIMGVIPVVKSLIGKGLPIGTSIAFMMSVAALSIPEFVLLKKVMKKELIAAYATIISVGIITIGITLNFLF